jgi:hypothetical protein
MPAGEQILGVNFLRRERSKGDVFQTAAAAIQKTNEEDVYVFLQVLLPSFLPSFPHLSSTIARPPVLLCGRTTRRRSLIFQQHGSRLPRLCSEAFLKQDKRSECILDDALRVCSYFCFPRKRWGGGGGGIKTLIVCCCNRVCDARHRSAYLSIASRERRLFDRESVLLRVASFLRVVVCTELVAVGVLRRLFLSTIPPPSLITSSPVLPSVCWSICTECCCVKLASSSPSFRWLRCCDDFDLLSLAVN